MSKSGFASLALLSLVVAAVLGGVVMARLGFAMHSGNHAAVARRSVANRLLGTIMDFVGGSSLSDFRLWRV